MELKALKSQADLVIKELVTHEIEDFRYTINALAKIPIRDYALHFALDNPSLRNDLIASLKEIAEKADKKDAVVFTLLAGIYWLNDDKENTVTNLDLALTQDSQYSLARLLNVAVTHGVPSRVWEDSLKAVTAEECLTGAV